VFPPPPPPLEVVEELVVVVVFVLSTGMWVSLHFGGLFFV
jgi:hypothetical protein